MEKTLANTVMALRRDFVEYCRGELQEWGISQGLLYFIIYIGKRPRCSLSDLSLGLEMDTGHTTRSIEKLVKIGFVTREKDVRDSRVRVLNLTPKGEQVFERSHRLFEEWDQTILKKISAQDRETLFRILGTLEKRQGGEDCVRND